MAVIYILRNARGDVPAISFDADLASGIISTISSTCQSSAKLGVSAVPIHEHCFNRHFHNLSTQLMKRPIQDIYVCTWDESFSVVLLSARLLRKMCDLRFLSSCFIYT